MPPSHSPAGHTAASQPTANPVLAQAQRDYDTRLVQVHSHLISKLQRPAGLQSLGAQLSGELGEAPELFIPYFVAMNVLNYQFWARAETGQLSRYAHEGLVGALAMEGAFQKVWLACLKQAGSDFPAMRSKEAARLLRDKILKAGIAPLFGDIPDMASRQTLLLEVLQPERLSSVAEILQAQCQSKGQLTWEAAQHLAQEFPLCYGDPYLKKAQLTLMFIAGQYQATTGARLHLDVTVAADYQLPKVLRSVGLISYCDELGLLVDGGSFVAQDSAFERAIRAATVLSCEELIAQFECSVAELDFWLWLNRNEDKAAKFHLTPTTAY